MPIQSGGHFQSQIVHRFSSASVISFINGNYQQKYFPNASESGILYMSPIGIDGSLLCHDTGGDPPEIIRDKGGDGL